MCFSAGASFGAGAVLSVIGVGSIRKAQSPSQVFFASIPLIFSVQQLSEGVLWLALQNSNLEPLSPLATYIFLFFAQVLWPVWVPCSILLLEKRKRRRMIGKILVGIGILVSAYLTVCLVKFPPVAQIVGYHISYGQDFTIPFSRFGGLLYALATIAPLFFSSVRRMWCLGLLIFISYIISLVFYTDYIVSVWCFFAAIISISIYGIMLGVKKTNHHSKDQEDKRSYLMPV